MTGRLASLNRFILRSAEKSLPFFKVLKGSENFHWGPEQDKAFEDLKQYLENLAVMTSPSSRAERLLYIATSSSAVSAALVEERMTGNAEAGNNLLHIRSPQWIEFRIFPILI